MPARIEHDHANAKGGFWVKPDGTSVPVVEPEGHYDTLRTLRDQGEITGVESSVVYHQGWARISFCAQGEFIGTFQQQVSPAALRQMGAIMRHHKDSRPRARVEQIYSLPYTLHGLVEDFYWSDEVEKVAPKLSAYTLARARAVKVAEAYTLHCQPSYTLNLEA